MVRKVFGRVVFGSGIIASIGLIAACSSNANPPALRSLERSGVVDVICLGENPAAKDQGGFRGLPLTDCQTLGLTVPGDFSDPHLYALVAQTTRGELAVVDLAIDPEKGAQVVDQREGVPGANFIPTGAQPVDVITDPAARGVIVASADPTRPALYGLGAGALRPCEGCETVSWQSWRGCQLPAVPSDVLAVYDPPVGEKVRTHCEDLPRASTTETERQFGRMKLLVTLPDAGGVLVVNGETLMGDGPDAQPQGELPGCDAELWIPMNTAMDLPEGVGQEVGNGLNGVGDGACVVEKRPNPWEPLIADPKRVSQPTSLAWRVDRQIGDDGGTQAGRMYVGDLSLPKIHVWDMGDVCAPSEAEPLWTLRREPLDVLSTARKVAVLEGRRAEDRSVLYAIDSADGSLMTFDLQSESVLPRQRPLANLNPTQPSDRLLFRAPVQDISLIWHDLPATQPNGEVAVEGLRCVSDPEAAQCDADTQSCDPGTLYRPARDNADGAGPATLRGAFALAALSDGHVAVVDIDDLDADCRGPKTYIDAEAMGCNTFAEGLFAKAGLSDGEDARADANALLETSYFRTGERSCSVALQDEIRAGRFFAAGSGSGATGLIGGAALPGVQTFPSLSDATGAVLSEFGGDPGSTAIRPILRAPWSEAFAQESAPGATEQEKVPTRALIVAGVEVPVDRFSGLAEDGAKLHDALLMNFEEARAHAADQEWRVIYEGSLPGLTRSTLGLEGAAGAQDQPRIVDADARYCDGGVQSRAAVEDQRKAWLQQFPNAQALAALPSVAEAADHLLVTSQLASRRNDYWESVSENICSYDQCLDRFGTPLLPGDGRWIGIAEAYQSELELALNADERATLSCCFPDGFDYELRAGAQWIVVGSRSGFQHHVVPAGDDGRCRPSCDPRLQEVQARVWTSPAGDLPVVASADESTAWADLFDFRNPSFRFAVSASPVAAETLVRGMTFRFFTTGSFVGMETGLTALDALILPQRLLGIPSAHSVLLTDGGLEGLFVIDLRRFGDLSAITNIY